MKSKKTIPIRRGCPDVLHLSYKDIRISFKEMHGCQGAYYPENSRIDICSGMSQREIANTFIHESLHAACHLYSLKGFFENDDKEEEFVNALSNAIIEIVVRNPLFVSLLESASATELD